jgi:ribosomal peptide maturation radical SAM protein 1
MRIALVNLPFAALQHPSLALTQLQAVLRAEFEDSLEVDTHYLNHDFGRLFGPQLYREISVGSEHLYSGLGDWLFRHVAFPDAVDNSTEYLRRFYPRSTPDAVKSRELIQSRRDAIGPFLDRLIADHSLLDADVVGLTTMFAQSMACFALARRLKDRRPDIVTVLGGANCEGPMGRAIAANVPVIDFVMSGPGLVSFPELIRRIAERRVSGPPIAGVFPGARSSIAAGIDVRADADLGREKLIDEPVVLDYASFLSALDRQFPFPGIKPVLLFETSRGCWWGAKAHCTFCGLNGSTMSFRSMSAGRALEQFRRLFEYAPRCTRFESTDNILPKSYLRDVLPHLETPEGVTLFYEVKADLSEEDVGTLAAAGVRSVQPGIEALSTSTLKLMRKGTSAFTNLRLLSHCRLYDVHPVWNLLVGFPGEEETVFQKYERDIPLLYHLPPPTGVYPVRFDRFSPYFEQREVHGLNLRPLEMYQYLYPFPPAAIVDIAYYFFDANFNAPYQVAMRKKLRALQEAVGRWRRRFGGEDGALPAELFLVSRDGRWIVRDSRDGQLTEHELNDESHTMLRRLANPVNRAEIDDAVTLQWLCDRRLVFQENDRIMSIVTPRAPARCRRYGAPAERPLAYVK